MFVKIFESYRLSKVYKSFTGKYPNLKNPRSFNEKIQWLKLNYIDYKMVLGSDKLLAKKYIADKGYKSYLPKLLGIYTSTDEIDYDKLPEQFVLKCTHGSGYVVICKNKSTFNKKIAKDKLDEWMKCKYGEYTGEWFYDIVHPKIIAEEYLTPSEGDDLFDYKIICMNGKSQLIFVIMNRKNKSKMTVDFYEIEWNKLNFTRKYRKSEILMEKPKELEDMLHIADHLCKDFPLVRVDFFLSGGKLYIGELTFAPGSGWEVFHPELYDFTYGNIIQLPNKKECKKKKIEFQRFLKKLRDENYKYLKLWK